MSVSIEQIKELREATGVSMMACKKALEEANGDFDGAVDILRKKGEAKAADRADKGVANGAVVVKIENGKAAIVQLGCETDFVAISDDFIQLAEALAAKLLNGEISAEDKDLPEVKEAVLKLGENVQIVNMKVVEGENLGDYVHSNKRIGVVVSLSGGSADLARDIAMHAAATNPKVISPDQVSQELVDKEKAIWSEQLAAEGKPAEIVENIMKGKEKKFREENALIKQDFVKDPQKTIEALLNEAGASVEDFVRMAF